MATYCTVFKTFFYDLKPVGAVEALNKGILLMLIPSQ